MTPSKLLSSTELTRWAMVMMVSSVASASWSAATVTVWGTYQSVGVKITASGSAVTSAFGGSTIATVTFPEGSEASANR